MSDRQPLTAQDLDRLTESITELSDQVEVLRDVLDEIRSDLQWAVQNNCLVALPLGCVEHTTVKRMGADPTAAEWGSRLELQTLRRPTESGVKHVTQTVDSVMNEVATAAIGLAWVRDQVREQMDAVEQTLLAAVDPNGQDSPQNEEVCDPVTGGPRRPLSSPQSTGPAAQRTLFDQPENRLPEPVSSSTVKPAAAEPHPSSQSIITPVYTLNEYRKFRERLNGGGVSLDELKAEFHRVQGGRESFITTLKQRTNANQLQGLAARFGCFDARRNNKSENAKHVYRTLLQSFLPENSIQYNPMQETLEQAVARQVESLTDAEWQQHIAERAEREQAEQKALANPETLDEFRLFVRERGVEGLSDDQRVRFDELSADASRAVRAAKQTEMVAQITGAGVEELALNIKEGWHDKRQCALWIVQLSDRVDRETYRELNRKAKMLGGWYSSFRKSNAGFQFLSEEHAQRFASLLDGDADRSDVLADRKSRKMETAAERLMGVADTLDAEASEILNTDETRLTNTVRRAEMAAGLRGRAYAQQAMAATLRSISEALDRGEVTYLDGIRAATHVSTLVSLLRGGKTRRNRVLLAEKEELGMWDRHHASEEFSNGPLAVEDAAFAEYPYPALSRHELQSLVSKASERKGLKQLSRRMQTFLVTDRDRHVVDFVDQHDIEFVIDYLDRCRAASLDTRWLECGLDDFKRMRAANIHTPQELRCALRELARHLQRKQQDDPVRKAEQQLIGCDIPGFFPTPRPVISRMLEIADIEPGHRVLEPSAGKGDILDMLREQHPDAQVTAIEINGTLHDVLAAKGHEVERGDFLEHSGHYDRIVMNPPFENGADIDHVRHAYEQLADGGRLVSIMSEGPFFRSDRKAEAFRAWLEEIGGTSEQLPEDAFNGRDAFRQTGVRTRIITIDRTTPHPADSAHNV